MERITVNMSPTAMLETCHASQFDVGVQKRFDLVDGSSAYTLTGAETITLKIRTPDGTLVESNVPNTSDSYVIWTSEAGELDAFGICLCSIHVTNGSDELGSGNFIMEVEADPYNGKNIRIVTVGPADICTFSTTLPEPLQSVIVNVEATGGNGTPDNPNPINGYSSANITRCGVNLWDEEWEVGGIDATTGNTWAATDRIRTKNYNPIVPNISIYRCSPNSVQIMFYTKNKTFISAGSWGSGSISVPNNAYFFKFQVDPAYGTTYNNDISINYPATDTTCHAYNGQTYTIAFGQTVYGGVLDVTRGKLHVTWAVDLISNMSWAYDSVNTRFSSPSLSSVMKAPTGIRNTELLCPIYNCLWHGESITPNVTDNVIYTSVGGGIYIHDLQYTVESDFVSARGNNPICYELSTPFDIDLTPVQIRALVGENNVFADCGQTTVKYLDEE